MCSVRCVCLYDFFRTRILITIECSLYWTNLYIDVLAPLFVEPIRHVGRELQRLGRTMFTQSSRRKFFARAGKWVDFYFPGASLPEECVCCCDLRFSIEDSNQTMCPPEPQECTDEHVEDYWMKRVV